MSQVKTFLQYWYDKVQSDGDKPFLKVVQSVTPPVLSYTNLAFQKRAMRVAVAFKTLLNVHEGKRVILLLDEPGDLALFLHGLWMAKICAIPVSSALPPDKLQQLIHQTGAEYVMFPPSYSARIASIIESADTVQNWIVTGKAGQVKGIQNVKSYEDLVLSATGEEIREELDTASDTELLLLPFFRSGVSTIGFTERALIHSAMALTHLYPDTPRTDLSWNTYPLFSYDGILHSILAPLFTPIPSLIMPISDLREFWRHLAANNVCFAAITHRDAEMIYSQGKARGLRYVDGLTLALTSESYFSYRVLSNFQERFEVPIRRFFTYEPAGGVISVASTEDATPQEDYLSAGSLLPDVEFRPGKNHNIFLRTNRMFRETSGAGWPAVSDGYLEVPFSGSLQDGRLWIEGKTDDIDYREGQQVNLARIEKALLGIRGVTYAVAACVPGKRNDREIGVFVATHRLANLKQSDLENELREILDPNELPYIYEFAANTDDAYPDRKELEDRLMFY